MLSDVQYWWCTLNGAMLSLSVGPMWLAPVYFFWVHTKCSVLLGLSLLLSLRIDDSLATKGLKSLSSGDMLWEANKVGFLVKCGRDFTRSDTISCFRISNTSFLFMPKHDKEP